MSDPRISFWKSLAIFLLLLLLGVYVLYEWYDDQLYAQIAEKDALLEKTREEVKEAEARRQESEKAQEAARAEIAGLKQLHTDENRRVVEQVADYAQAKTELEQAMADLKDAHAAQLAAEQQRFNELQGERDQLAARLASVEASYDEAKKQVAELEANLGKINEAIAKTEAEHQAKIEALERHLNERVELARTTPMDESLLRAAQEAGVLPVVEAFQEQCDSVGGELQESKAELASMKAGYATMEQQLAEAQAELGGVRAQLQEAEAAAAESVGEDASAEDKAALEAQLAAEAEVREALLLQHEAAVAALQERLGETEAALESTKQQVAELKAAAEVAVVADGDDQGESDARGQVESLQASLEEERAQAEQAQSKLRDEIEGLKEQLTDVQAQLQETLAETEPGSSAELEAAKGRIGALEDELELARRAADEARELEVALERMREREASFAQLNGTYTDRGLLLRLAESELRFLPGRATLPAGELGSLDRISALLDKEEGLSVRIEGHTDSVGSDELNLNLSQQRAQAVQQALIERGVDPDRMQAEGIGSARPIATNATAAGRSKNRRVEIYLVD
ncbi:OmpA family protein [Thiorhodococcus minor]|uniref:OmpA family protein n=1 Tax=Thiorhodococcus minor TaxID=57489 RepID=A0A6M0K028_9GAMM|nr:OmpA family protein [Thiorhodococcus minor]NEV61937.1 OmpA family protein [Thiorhodococcus minor]